MSAFQSDTPSIIILNECESTIKQCNSTTFGFKGGRSINKLDIVNTFKYLIKYTNNVMNFDVNLCEQTLKSSLTKCGKHMLPQVE